MPETVEKLREPIVQAASSLVDAISASVARRLPDLETQNSKIACDLGAIRQQVGGLTSVNQLLESASQANHLLSKQHYTDHVITPMLRSLFPVFDLIEDSLNHRSEDDPSAGMNQKPLIAIWYQLEQFLSNYDVHILKHEKGTQFDPKTMKPVTRVQTDDERLHKRIAESLQIGFQMNDQQILRLETVSIFNCET
jgi:molecular chaperone GrpE (heat shock protein)